MNKKFFSLFLFLFLSSCSQGELQKVSSVWKSLPVQYQGRVKPFDTFSREILKSVYAKDHYKERSAVEIVLSWLIVPDSWEDIDFIFVEKEIKKSLDLPLKQSHFSPSQLKSSSSLALYLAELQALKQRGENLDSYFKTLEKLETRLIIYGAVQSGYLIRLEPPPQGDRWRALSEMSPPAEKLFKKMLLTYIQFISQNVSDSLGKQLQEESALKAGPLSKENDFYGKHFKAEKESLSLEQSSKDTSLEKSSVLLRTFEKEMAEFQNLIFKGQKESFFHPLRIQTEIFYNSFKPFQKAWIFYLLSLLVWIFISLFKKDRLFPWLLPFSFLAFAIHSLGMFLRSYIMMRPPVSNMYETVVWVPWVAFVAGFVFYLKGSRLALVSSILLAFFCLLLTSLAPEILDGSLQPLEAVLRSSFWLTTHVLTITMSYSFFFLAFVLADMALIYYLFSSSQPLSLVNKLFTPIYRSIQWGVVLLAMGTLLGAIWADYSWGRFWAWDPKESWALVSFLAYLALLHSRLSRWIGPFGLAVGSVLMFFSIIMAWYGVNYVLGAGLHSYGFGSGGLEYVSGFLFLHLLLCALVFWKKNRKI